MQPKPEYLTQLIDMASKATGNDSRLAKELKVGRSAVNDWRAGRKTCPAVDQALMASLAGLESEKWLIRATLAQYEGTPKGDDLYKALGKPLLATGAAFASFGANAHPIFSHDGINQALYFIRCILLLGRKRLYRDYLAHF